MRILVNHLTRMQPGYICVAGLEPATGRHIRPVLPYGRLRIDMLRRNGGPFAVGRVVDLGPARLVGRAPELEDHMFLPERAACLRSPGAAGYWTALERAAHTNLEDVFGPELAQRGRSCTVEAGGGRASLGCLVPSEQPSLFLDERGRVRMQLSDGKFSANLSVTDLRLYEPDLWTSRTNLIRRVARRITGGEEMILSVGLTREWKKVGDPAPRHWLQVNNINLKGAPEPEPRIDGSPG